VHFTHNISVTIAPGWIYIQICKCCDMCIKLSEPFRQPKIEFLDIFLGGGNFFAYAVFFFFVCVLLSCICLNNRENRMKDGARTCCAYSKNPSCVRKMIRFANSIYGYDIGSCAVLADNESSDRRNLSSRVRASPRETMTKEWRKVTIGKFQVKMFPDSGIVSRDAINS